MKKIWVVIGLNFTLAVLASLVSGLAFGAAIAVLTVGWLYVWQRNLFTAEMIFRILNIQFCVCNLLMLWHWRVQ